MLLFYCTLIVQSSLLTDRGERNKGQRTWREKVSIYVNEFIRNFMYLFVIERNRGLVVFETKFRSGIIR